MSTFTEDFQRRLRAVLAKHTGREIPDNAVIEIVADGASYGDDDSRGLDLELRIRTVISSGVFAEHIYDEPGAGVRLVADLEAVPDEPTLSFVAVKRDTGDSQPATWYAWDALNTRYYLRYSRGRGTIRLMHGDLLSDVAVREFLFGTSDQITIEAFAEKAGVDISRLAEWERG